MLYEMETQFTCMQVPLLIRLCRSQFMLKVTPLSFVLPVRVRYMHVRL